MAQLNIRIDDTLKSQGEKLFNDLGLNFSSAISMFISQAVREQAIPFRSAIGDQPNSATVEAITNVNKGVGLSKKFSSVKELMEDLDADD